MEANRKNKLFVEKVLEYFDFIFDINFELKEIKTEKMYKSTDNDIFITFDNDKIKFKIYFMSKNAKNEDYNNISFHLTNIELEGWESFLGLDEFLTKYMPNYDTKKLYYFNYQGTFEERLDILVKEFSNILKNDLYDVLIGNKWYTDCYTEP